MKENTIWQLALESYLAEKQGDINYIYDDRNKEFVSHSREEIMNKAIRFAMSCKEKNKHIGVYVGIGTDWLVAFFSIVFSGNVAVLLDKRLPDAVIAKYIEMADVDYVVYDQVGDGLKEIEEKSTWTVKSIEDWLKEVPEGNVSVEEYQAYGDENDICAMLFTSGTTGVSKCVCLSQKNIVTDVRDSINYCHYTKEDRFMGILPPAHVFGMTQIMLSMFYLGCQTLYSNDIVHLIDNMKKFEPTGIILIPMIVEFIYRKLELLRKKYPGQKARDLAEGMLGRNIKYMPVGGSACNPQILEGMEKYGIAVRAGYGLTETSSTVTANMEPWHYATSVGKCVGKGSIRIQEGEILIKSETIMVGYYKNKEETDKVLKDGWFATGDLGYLDEEGNLYLTGRKKNLIVLSNGENISPEYIEQQILGDRRVKEVCIRERNDRIIAEIYPDPELLKPEEARQQLMKTIETINEDLPFYSKVMDIVIRENEFEKNANGKMIR